MIFCKNQVEPACTARTKRVKYCLYTLHQTFSVWETLRFYIIIFMQLQSCLWWMPFTNHQAKKVSLESRTAVSLVWAPRPFTLFLLAPHAPSLLKAIQIRLLANQQSTLLPLPKVTSIRMIRLYALITTLLFSSTKNLVNKTSPPKFCWRRTSH